MMPSKIMGEYLVTGEESAGFSDFSFLQIQGFPTEDLYSRGKLPLVVDLSIPYLSMINCSHDGLIVIVKAGPNLPIQLL